MVIAEIGFGEVYLLKAACEKPADKQNVRKIANSICARRQKVPVKAGREFFFFTPAFHPDAAGLVDNPTKARAAASLFRREDLV